MVGPPHGGVKEQGPGVYAQQLARRGFVAIGFDPSYNGESSGEPRHLTSPELFAEDFSAGVGFLGTLPYVDRERIGAVGICGSGGFTSTPRLVVEDEPDLAEGLRIGLCRAGYAVDVAATVAQAYERLTVNEYDAILLDINLPDGDGFALCHDLREGRIPVPGAEEPRVLMLTARGALPDRSAGSTQAPTTTWSNRST